MSRRVYCVPGKQRIFPLKEDMIKFLFCFNGKSTRKEWWMVTLATLAAEALLYLLVPACPWLLAACAAVLVPWLAVSSRRLESTGNSP